MAGKPECMPERVNDSKRVVRVSASTHQLVLAQHGLQTLELINIGTTSYRLHNTDQWNLLH